MIGEFQAARGDRTRAVLEGFHAVKHAIRFGAVLERTVAVDLADVAALAARLAPDVAERLAALVETVPPTVFEQLAPRPVPTGVIAIAVRPPDAGDLSATAPAVLLEDPRHLANVGACVRVAAAAGAAGVVVSGSRDPWAPEALRGSAGLHFALPVVHGEAPQGRPLVAFDADGGPFDPAALPDDAVLAFGSERDGLTAALTRRADAVVALPMAPGVSSLNLATSVSAALYAWRLAS